MKRIWIKKTILLTLMLSLSLLSIVCIENCLEISEENHLAVSETHAHFAADKNCGECSIASPAFISAIIKSQTDFIHAEKFPLSVLRTTSFARGKTDFPPNTPKPPFLTPPLKILRQLRI